MAILFFHIQTSTTNTNFCFFCSQKWMTMSLKTWVPSLRICLALETTPVRLLLPPLEPPQRLPRPVTGTPCRHNLLSPPICNPMYPHTSLRRRCHPTCQLISRRNCPHICRLICPHTSPPICQHTCLPIFRLTFPPTSRPSCRPTHPALYPWSLWISTLPPSNIAPGLVHPRPTLPTYPRDILTPTVVCLLAPPALLPPTPTIRILLTRLIPLTPRPPCHPCLCPRGLPPPEQENCPRPAVSAPILESQPDPLPVAAARAPPATSALTVASPTPPTPASASTASFTVRRPRATWPRSPSAASTVQRCTLPWVLWRCISARTHCHASVTCAVRLSRDPGCFRGIFARTPARSPSRATIAGAPSPTAPTCARTCRPTPRWRSIRACPAARPSRACPCSASTLRAAAPATAPREPPRPTSTGPRRWPPIDTLGLHPANYCALDIYFIEKTD